MRGTVPALSISGAAGGCPYIERKEKKMKKETIMKIICPAVLLCLSARAGFMAGKMNTEKKEKNRTGPGLYPYQCLYVRKSYRNI